MAQSDGPSCLIFGEVRTGETFGAGGLMVQASRTAGGSEFSNASVHADGSFELPGLVAGTYLVSIHNQLGAVVWQDFVQVAPGVTPLTVQLNQPSDRLGRPATISVNALEHKPSREAIRELKLAEKASKSGNRSELIAHLKRAVELAPSVQFVRNDLGASYLHLGDFDSARRELEAAVALDPESPVPHANLALTLLCLRRAPEAEQEANQALRRDPLFPAANYAAGLALTQEGRLNGALVLLDRAAAGVPAALLTQAQILLQLARTPEAVAKLRSYLSHHDVPRRAEVTRWMQTLLGQTASR